MFVLNGEASKGVQILQKYGLSQCESRVYFTVLVLSETSVWNISKQSGVHHSKIYWVLDKLQEKRLVAKTQEFPKKFVALPFQAYLGNYVKVKQKEIAELREGRKELRKVVHKLQPIALRYGDKIQIFEPSCRRGLNSSRSEHA